MLEFQLYPSKRSQASSRLLTKKLSQNSESLTG